MCYEFVLYTGCGHDRSLHYFRAQSHTTSCLCRHFSRLPAVDSVCPECDRNIKISCGEEVPPDHLTPENRANCQKWREYVDNEVKDYEAKRLAEEVASGGLDPAFASLGQERHVAARHLKHAHAHKQRQRQKHGNKAFPPYVPQPGETFMDHIIAQVVDNAKSGGELDRLQSANETGPQGFGWVGPNGQESWLRLSEEWQRNGDTTAVVLRGPGHLSPTAFPALPCRSVVVTPPSLTTPGIVITPPVSDPPKGGAMESRKVAALAAGKLGEVTPQSADQQKEVTTPAAALQRGATSNEEAEVPSKEKTEKVGGEEAKGAGGGEGSTSGKEGGSEGTMKKTPFKLRYDPSKDFIPGIPLESLAVPASELPPAVRQPTPAPGPLSELPPLAILPLLFGKYEDDGEVVITEGSGTGSSFPTTPGATENKENNFSTALVGPLILALQPVSDSSSVGPSQDLSQTPSDQSIRGASSSGSASSKNFTPGPDYTGPYLQVPQPLPKTFVPYEPSPMVPPGHSPTYAPFNQQYAPSNQYRSFTPGSYQGGFTPRSQPERAFTPQSQSERAFTPRSQSGHSSTPRSQGERTFTPPVAKLQSDNPANLHRVQRSQNVPPHQSFGNNDHIWTREFQLNHGFNMTRGPRQSNYNSNSYNRNHNGGGRGRNWNNNRTWNNNRNWNDNRNWENNRDWNNSHGNSFQNRDNFSHRGNFQGQNLFHDRNHNGGFQHRDQNNFYNYNNYNGNYNSFNGPHAHQGGYSDQNSQSASRNPLLPTPISMDMVVYRPRPNSSAAARRAPLAITAAGEPSSSD
ncbi:hypothetical protein TWF730_003695 [Orbilia blumenaviensis]|uniref:Uncharacterized protein n=1 Tax=Orbilia blumenaviensis TaxID=1796055 RepID=A0AAV9U7C1_9PEZI